MITTVVTVAGAVCVILIGTIMAMQNSKIEKVDEKADKIDCDEKTDKAMCDQRYGDMLARLGRGVERFDKIDKTLDTHNTEQVKQGKVLVKVLTILERLDRNGGSRKVKK